MPEIVNGISLEVVSNPEAGAELLANKYLEKAAEPKTNIMTSTGRTFEPIYANLRHESSSSFRNVTFLNQDEYCLEIAERKFKLVDEDNEHSFRRFMREQLFDHINFPLRNSHFPTMENYKRPGAFDALIGRLGGIDVAFLGLGRNGHLGFNEPWSGFGCKTHLVALTEETRLDNAKPGQKEPVPEWAITVGLGTLAASKEIQLVVFGKHKSQTLHDALLGPITTEMPASVLQRHATKISVVADEAAAALL
jgi:glucosamine-6-phosphate deaminase